MKHAGSFGALKSAIAHYDGCFYLRNPDKKHRIDTVDDLYKDIGEIEEGSHIDTDILIL
jgi:hypothetical protein